jgi:hypothetical protein
MARRPCSFKEVDLKRAIRATMSAGIAVARVEIDKDGKIVIVTSAEVPQTLASDLDAELEAHEARRKNARSA